MSIVSSDKEFYTFQRTDISRKGELPFQLWIKLLNDVQEKNYKQKFVFQQNILLKHQELRTVNTKQNHGHEIQKTERNSDNQLTLYILQSEYPNKSGCSGKSGGTLQLCALFSASSNCRSTIMNVRNKSLAPPRFSTLRPLQRIRSGIISYTRTVSCLNIYCTTYMPEMGISDGIPILRCKIFQLYGNKKRKVQNLSDR